MKTKIIIVMTFLLLPILMVKPAFSQKTEKVYSIIKSDKPFEWYTKQADLWKKVIDSDPKNPAAWVNFYTANRMARLTNPEAWRQQKVNGFMELDEIVKEMKKEIPGTYEYYHVKVWNDGYQTEENADDLLKAYAMAPDRPDIYSSLVNYYEMKRDHKGEAEICKKWFDCNELSPNLLNYNYNVLMSLEDNGIIITNGDNDTYPLWVLQYALGKKKNVVVVNINLITVDSYGKKLFEENNIPADDFKALEDYSSSNPVVYAGYTILTPMPGTVFHKQVKHKIIDHDYLRYNFFNSVLKTTLPYEKFHERVGSLWLVKKGTDVI